MDIYFNWMFIHNKYLWGTDVEQVLMSNTLFLIACSSINTSIWVMYDKYLERTFQCLFKIENYFKIFQLLSKKTVFQTDYCKKKKVFDIDPS